MSSARRLLPAVLLALLAAPAAAGADVRGQQVGGARGVGRTTAELDGASLGRLPARVQPVEHEAEPPPKRPNPGSPPAADGRPRTRAATLRSAAISSGGTFDGPTLADAQSYPPDSQGDIGPTQYVVMVNGRVRSYDKATGQPDGALNADTDVFWASAMTPVGPGTGLTSNFTSDPHIRYDRLSGRWIAVMIDVPGATSPGDSTNRVMVAVSSGATIGPSTTWRFFWFSAPAGEFADYPTLGVDANALYVGTNEFSLAGAFLNSNVYVVRKSSVLGTGPIQVTGFRDVIDASGSGPYTPQGVDDADPAATTGWFVGADDGTSGLLDLLRVDAPASATPTLSGPLRVTVPQTAYPSSVPQPAGSTSLDALDDRLFAAQVRGGRLWTAHNVAVGASGASSGTTSRVGSRWYELSLGASPSLVQSGTVFDTAATNPRSYWIPSVAVDGVGAMVVGGSVGGKGEHADAWYAGRAAGDPAGTAGAPTTYTAATASYAPGNDRWGDYSLTRVDPEDDMTFWTIQEYVTSTNTWGVRVARVLAPAPAAPTAASVTGVRAGQTGVAVTLTGPAAAGWYDPGVGFSKRLSVSVGCGVAVTSVGYRSPTSIDLTLDTTAATPGPCDVTVTNPDGQSATATGLLAVTAGADSPPVAHDDGYVVPASGALDGTSVLANDTDPDGDRLTASLVSAPAHGAVTVNADGTFHYQATSGYAGADAFTYSASDGTLSSSPATVSLTVAAGPPSGTGTGGGGSGGGGGGGGGSGAGSATPTTPDTTPAAPTAAVVAPALEAPTVTAVAPPLLPVALRCAVPLLRGHTLRGARSLLAAAGCALGRISGSRRGAVRRGRIVGSTPPAGAVRPAGARVSVAVRR